MELDRSGLRLHYDVTGTDGETIVLTHGLGASGRTWSAVAAALTPRYRVVTWDLRAHGRSASIDEPCDVATLGEDLAAVAVATSDAPVHVLGHSAGGVLAMRFALDHPDRVRTLTLVGTSSECNARAAAFYESLAEIGVREGGVAVLRRLGQRGDDALAPEGRGFAHVARAMGSLHAAPLTVELERVRCPALVVVGEKDALGVGGSVIISRRLPHARLEIVPERGHAIFHEDPPAFARMVLAFLVERPVR